MTRRFIAVVALCVATAALVGAFALNRSRSGNSSAAAASNNITASNGASSSPPTEVAAQTVRFTVYDVGILPRQAKARAGNVARAIEDLSGASAELVVAKINGNGVAAGRVGRSPGSWRVRTVIRLVPGTYEVFDANRPNNRAELVVTP